MSAGLNLQNARKKQKERVRSNNGLQDIFTFVRRSITSLFTNTELVTLSNLRNLDTNESRCIIYVPIYVNKS
jgi:hypothetical protein